jgi:hypothetical protein
MAGNLSCIDQTHTIYDAIKLNCEFLSKQMGVLPKKQMFRVIADALKDMPPGERDAFFSNWEEYTCAVYNSDDNSSVSTID